jgi:hypothetical protein
MPIRFRCVYCNQLLGISRRKAGTIVRCTTCEGQLIVPNPDDPATTEPAGAQGESEPSSAPAGGGLLEQSDFDAILEPQAAVPKPAAVASPPAPPQASPSVGKRSVFPSLPISPPVRSGAQPALVLTRQRLTVVSVCVVIGLGLAFAGGLLLGLSLR